ncbi:hypothetical protein, partial [Acidaminobacter sp.]|uniref:hypothetical protein n=1 Tax=Acidaminobacter sp. TaxID=1872102 RepID=UPI0025B7CC67
TILYSFQLGQTVFSAVTFSAAQVTCPTSPLSGQKSQDHFPLSTIFRTLVPCNLRSMDQDLIAPKKAFCVRRGENSSDALTMAPLTLLSITSG